MCITSIIGRTSDEPSSASCFDVSLYGEFLTGSVGADTDVAIVSNCEMFACGSAQAGDGKEIIIVENSNNCLRVGNFEMRKEHSKSSYTRDINEWKPQFSLTTKTVACNMLKVLRGMQVNTKPILLEGTPGVGKTSSIIALAQITGNLLVRINLSDQTEISDLFSDCSP